LVGTALERSSSTGASETPQNLQNCEVASFVPRQRAQMRVALFVDGAGPTSTTRAGAIARWASAAGAAGDNGGAGCAVGAPWGAGGGAAATGAGGLRLGVSGFPHAMQKRSPRWFI
jgi:hypothetical protein